MIEKITSLVGDCMEVLPTLPADSVDSCVTDPPYHLVSISSRFGPGQKPAGDVPDGRYGRLSRGFMGQVWDGGDIAFRPELWAEVMRVLKPGAHLLAFGGTRTYHRMACAIEDAGFEIRDCIQWLYGSGFPKSHDVSKGIDRRGGVSVNWFGPWLRKWREDKGITQKQIAALFPSKTGGLTGCVANWELGLNLPTNEQFNLICETFGFPFASMAEAERDVIATIDGSLLAVAPGQDNYRPAIPLDITAPATDSARQWQGWGTALKPCAELLVLARKQLSERTVAANVLKWGVGALNIDGCRIPAVDVTAQRPYDNAWEKEQFLCDSCADLAANKTKHSAQATRESIATNPVAPTTNAKVSESQPDTDIMDIGCSDGTRPENISTNLSIEKSGKKQTDQSHQDMKSIISTETRATTDLRICVSCGAGITEAFTNGNTKLAKNGSQPMQQERGRVVGRWPGNVIHDGSEEVVKGFPDAPGQQYATCPQYDRNANVYGKFAGVTLAEPRGDEGSAARFFYTAKADQVDRIGSRHPTVKPLDLMQYLVRLVTPKGGLVLDCFAGTGTTGEAAFREGFRAILIEREAEYLKDIERRIALCMAGPVERANAAMKAKLNGKPRDDGPLFAQTWDDMWAKPFDRPELL